jgi:hypothetical protein
MILGKHTLTETRDLIKVVEYRYQQTDKAVAEAVEKVHKAQAEHQPYDEAAATDLDYDWKKLAQRWDKERDEVSNQLRMKAIALFGVPADLMVTEEEWARVIPYVQESGWTKGSWMDIVSRLKKLGVSPDYSNDPKQTTKDWDLDALRNLDAAIQVTEGAASKAKEAAKNAATSKTGIIVGAAVIGTVAGVVALKHYLG